MNWTRVKRVSGTGRDVVNMNSLCLFTSRLSLLVPLACLDLLYTPLFPYICLSGFLTSRFRPSLRFRLLALLLLLFYWLLLLLLSLLACRLGR